MLTPEQIKSLRRSDEVPNGLRKAMELTGLTQVRLAEAVGLTQPYISQLVNGNHPSLPVETAGKLSDFFGCQIEDLFPSRAA